MQKDNQSAKKGIMMHPPPKLQVVGLYSCNRRLAAWDSSCPFLKTPPIFRMPLVEARKSHGIVG